MIINNSEGDRGCITKARLNDSFQNLESRDKAELNFIIQKLNSVFRKRYMARIYHTHYM